MTPEEISEQTKELQTIQSTYSLVSIGKPIAMAQQLRQDLMKSVTDSFYLETKPGSGHIYVKSFYMDDTFKKFFPIHTIEITKSEPVASYWYSIDVLIKAYLTPNIFICNPGSDAVRIQISEAKGKAIKAGTLSFGELNPMDWVDLGDAKKSALTLAIANAQSRFGVAADIYGKDVVSAETRDYVEKAMNEIINRNNINPMTKLNIQREWLAVKEKKKGIMQFYNKIAKQYQVFENTEFEEIKLKT